MKVKNIEFYFVHVLFMVLLLLKLSIVHTCTHIFRFDARVPPLLVMILIKMH